MAISSFAAYLCSLPFAPATRRFKMEVITAVAAWAISSACRSVPADSWFGATICDRRSDPKELADRLSQAAEVYVPGDEGFDTATRRWSVLDAPTISVVVVPSVENDVAETVRVL